MYPSHLLEIYKLEDDLQEIESLISHLNSLQIQYDYLQKITFIHKTLVQSLLEYSGFRAPNTVFTLEDLKQNYSGKNNQPAYIAIDGIVYDVSYEPTWGGSTHFGLSAGTDVSEALTKCHSQDKDSILNQLTPVGVLES